VFGFWYARSMKDPKKVMEKSGAHTAMGNFGRITSLKDLPPKSILTAYVKEAMALNESGGPRPSPMTRSIPPSAPAKVPAWFLTALKKKPKAAASFRSFPPGQQREYITWLTDAKTDETKQKRLKQAVDWIAQGKYRNWKYMK